MQQRKKCNKGKSGTTVRQFEMSGAWRPHLHEMATPSPIPKQFFISIHLNAKYIYREREREQDIISAVML